MSLFGSTPPDTATPSKKSAGLFGDDGDDDKEASTSSRKAASGLFSDGANGGDDEDDGGFLGGSGNRDSGIASGGLGGSRAGEDAGGWSMPTPRKGRADMVRGLLSEGKVPASYREILKTILQSGASADDNEGGWGSGAGGQRESVSVEEVKTRVLGGVGLSERTRGKILGLVAGEDAASDTMLGKGELLVLLALIGLAQDGEEVSLDAVDERRKDLPKPSIDGLEPSRSQYVTPQTSLGQPPPPSARNQEPTTPTPHRKSTASTTNTAANTGTSARSRPMQRNSGGFGFSESEQDPWGSPVGAQGPTQDQSGPPDSSAAMPPRTTSTFTTSADQGVGPASDTGAGWGGPDADAGFGGFGRPSSADAVAGGAPGSSSGNAALAAGGTSSRALGGGDVKSGADEDRVRIVAIPEKEGMFLFQHHNYEVSSAKRGSKVVRRYSDFTWLLDCLHKKFPFRQLPLLPPKRVAINGNYLAADNTFLEKRRRGLARFANALVRHPVLNQEQLVVMFLTVPTELQVWRKQAAISVQEEFNGKALPAGLEDSLTPDLDDLFETVRGGVRRSADIYINVCNVTERLSRRQEGIASDLERFAHLLGTLAGASKDTYKAMPDLSEVGALNEGLGAVGKHFLEGAALLEDEARASDAGVLEDFKRQRDSLVSMRDMFDRRDKLSKDNIPQLENRIKSNEGKLEVIRAKPEGQQRPGEAEKVEESIFKDKQSIVAQHARGVFIRECVRDEIKLFQNSLYHVGRAHVDWVRERVKYSELLDGNWKSLSREAEVLPQGD